MGIAMSRVLASLEPCFYARSIARMALRTLTEKHFSSDEVDREIGITQISQGVPILPPQTLCCIAHSSPGPNRRDQKKRRGGGGYVENQTEMS